MEKWKLWTLVGVVAALIVAVVVLHLVQPEVTFAFAEVMSLVSFICGGVCGWLIGSRKTTKTEVRVL